MKTILLVITVFSTAGDHQFKFSATQDYCYANERYIKMRIMLDLQYNQVNVTRLEYKCVTDNDEIMSYLNNEIQE